MRWGGWRPKGKWETEEDKENKWDEEDEGNEEIKGNVEHKEHDEHKEKEEEVEEEEGKEMRRIRRTKGLLVAMAAWIKHYINILLMLGGKIFVHKPNLTWKKIYLALPGLKWTTNVSEGSLWSLWKIISICEIELDLRASFIDEVVWLVGLVQKYLFLSMNKSQTEQSKTDFVEVHYI